ncbi:(2Fe-2S)-binding protein [Candidatus Vallotia cooleyia]|uniref:(2Fe-2S)-binding protein n=1 Tax=Candidatus Vallotiella adelgis TaxID=1177211 RepID=UPI001D02806A|nr:(2Fe-2S)-binding protein [Candidatus Vallotia cooleyia]UDG82300.1 hypothetical protein GJV44_00560 [Candidatus Vallotia cooleyia]
MIVCICKSVSHHAIRAALESSALTFDELQFEFGVATCCGKCKETVYDLLSACDSRTNVARHISAGVSRLCYTNAKQRPKANSYKAEE